MYALVATILPLLCLVLIPMQSRAQCEAWIQGPISDGLPTGANGILYTSLTWDPDGAGPLPERLVVGGSFSTIGGVPAQNIAQYNPDTASWEPFGQGIGTRVNCLAEFEGQLVAGANGDTNANTLDGTVLRWTGSAWTNLSWTNTGNVLDMVVHNGVLFIGGTFQTNFVTQGSNPAYRIAWWDAAGSLWDSMEEADFGTTGSGSVNALAVYNGELYAGGHKSGLVHLTHSIGQFWTSLPLAVESGAVNDLKVFANELLVGGKFSIGNGLFSWNGTSSSTFASGFSSIPVSGATQVKSITIHDNAIVVGGLFNRAGSAVANNVARWPSGASDWQALGGGTNGLVNSVASYLGSLVAVGAFTDAEGPADRIAQWNGNYWGPVSGGTAAAVLAMVPYRDRLVGGGSFVQPASGFTTANQIAGWDGDALTAFGTGFNSTVWALESFQHPGNGPYGLIAGGDFTSADGLPASRIAQWWEYPEGGPASGWVPMGLGFSNTVLAIEQWGTTTYAGGLFTLSGGNVVNYITRWNVFSQTWDGIGGTDNAVRAIKEYNGALYVGGSFITAGGVLSPGIARWNGTSWSSLPGFTGTVFALEVHDGKLIIGGQFTGFGQTNLVAYDGTSVAPLGSGTDGAGVRALLSTGDRLYVGGSFGVCGGVAATNAAMYDGSWHALGGGVNAAVNTLGRLGGETHFGGFFSTINGSSLNSPRWGRFTETGLPYFTQHPSSQTVSLGATESLVSEVVDGFPFTGFQWYQDDLAIANGVRPDGSLIVGAQSKVLVISNIVPSDQGTYRVEATNGCGSISSTGATLTLDATAAPVLETLTTIFRAVGPNPTRRQTAFFFSLDSEASVDFAVHDLRGRLVRRVDLGQLAAGQHQAAWDAKDRNGGGIAAGVYFVTMDVNGERFNTKRMTIVR